MAKHWDAPVDKYYTTPEFMKLRKQWAEKLKDSGFNDLEKGFDQTPYLDGKGVAVDFHGAQSRNDRANYWHELQLEGLGTPAGQQTKEDLVNSFIGYVPSMYLAVMIRAANGYSERENRDFFEVTRHRIRVILKDYYAATGSALTGVPLEKCRKLVSVFETRKFV